MAKFDTFMLAPQEALKFHRRMEDIFLALILDRDAWISDRSVLSDFISRNDPRYAKGPGSRPGYYIFERTKPRMVKDLSSEEADYFVELQRTRREIKIELVEEKGDHHTALIIRRTKFYFGVDITSVIDETFPKIFQHISENMTAKRRLAMEPDGWIGRRLARYQTSPNRVASTYWPHSPGYYFRVDEYADGRCVIYQRKRRGEERSAGSRPNSSRRFRKLFTAPCFDTSVLRPRLDAWLKEQGELPMDPWGRDDPRNIAKETEWERTRNKDGSVTATRKKKDGEK